MTYGLVMLIMAVVGVIAVGTLATIIIKIERKIDR